MKRVKLKPKVERVKLDDTTNVLSMPDWVARKVIVAAFLYYVMDAPIMSDGEYDRMSNYVADNWDALTPDRQWALRDPASTRAGGSHIRFSLLAAGAAINQHKYKTGEHWLINGTCIKHRKKDEVLFVTTACEVYRDKRFSPGVK